ncbi:MAG: hypothetical protein B0A82_09440 [Alkalinema sp. CACIAM 70d]|nr:MAG: hypothetical protein B0A82_09440 [Alkalinema sp. CACIAM 70d]
MKDPLQENSLDHYSNHCPCCSDTLLRHARGSELYWLCRHCRQEMPNLLHVRITHFSQSSLPQTRHNLLTHPHKVVHYAKSASPQTLLNP